MRPVIRPDWTPVQAASVAALILDPATNGGTRSDLTPEDVRLPDVPALGLFDGDRCAFLVSLHPYDPAVPRGILHVAGTGEVRDAYRIVASFCDALPGTDILTFSDRPALIRLARRAGFTERGVMNGYTVLQRDVPGPQPGGATL